MELLRRLTWAIGVDRAFVGEAVGLAAQGTNPTLVVINLGESSAFRGCLPVKSTSLVLFREL